MISINSEWSKTYDFEEININTYFDGSASFSRLKKKASLWTRGDPPPCFFFFSFSKVEKVKYLPHLLSNHRNFSVDLPMVNIYKFCKKRNFDQIHFFINAFPIWTNYSFNICDYSCKGC